MAPGPDPSASLRGHPSRCGGVPIPAARSNAVFGKFHRVWTVANTRSLCKRTLSVGLLSLGWWFGLAGAPAGAQIPTSSTTSTTEPDQTTTTTRPTPTTRRTTTTTAPSSTTTTGPGSTTSRSGGSTTSTSRGGSTTSTTEEEDDGPTSTTSTIPTPGSTTPTTAAVGPGSAEISPIFPWLSALGLAVAAGLAGTRWYQTRPEKEISE